MQTQDTFVLASFFFISKIRLNVHTGLSGNKATRAFERNIYYTSPKSGLLSDDSAND